MKKLLLATSLLGALSTSAIAKEHGMYIRADFNGGWLVDGISADAMKGGQLIVDDASNKPMAWWVQGGFGSCLMDSVRIELNAFYLMDTDFDAVTSTNAPTATYTALTTGANPQAAIVNAGGAPASVSSKITVGSYGLLARGYFDIADFGGAKLFVGATGGYAWTTVDQVLTAVSPSTGGPVSGKSDKYGDLAYGFNAGFSYEISDSAELNLEYSYLHLADVKDDGNNDPYATPYHVNAHNIGLGVRFYF